MICEILHTNLILPCLTSPTSFSNRQILHRSTSTSSWPRQSAMVDEWYVALATSKTSEDSSHSRLSRSPRHPKSLWSVCSSLSTASVFDPGVLDVHNTKCRRGNASRHAWKCSSTNSPAWRCLAKNFPSHTKDDQSIRGQELCKKKVSCDRLDRDFVDLWRPGDSWSVNAKDSMTLSTKLPMLKSRILLLAVAFHFDLVFLK